LVCARDSLVNTNRFKFVDKCSKMFNRDVFFEDHLYVVNPLTLGVVYLRHEESHLLVRSVSAVPFSHDFALRIVRNYAALAEIYLGGQHSCCCWYVCICSPIFSRLLTGPPGIIGAVIILLVASLRDFALIAKSGHHRPRFLNHGLVPDMATSSGHSRTLADVEELQLTALEGNGTEGIALNRGVLRVEDTVLGGNRQEIHITDFPAPMHFVVRRGSRPDPLLKGRPCQDLWL